MSRPVVGPPPSIIVTREEAERWQEDASLREDCRRQAEELGGWVGITTLGGFHVDVWQREHWESGLPVRGSAMSREQIEVLIWGGDVQSLQVLLPCRCCCDEHTFEWCEARAWGGCRGQGSMTRADHEAWARHYAEFHGMSRDQFFGWESNG